MYLQENPDLLATKKGRDLFKENLAYIVGTEWEQTVFGHKPYKVWAREMDDKYFNGQKHFQLGEHYDCTIVYEWPGPNVK